MPQEEKREKTQQEVSRVANLPTLPAVALELIRRWNDPELTISGVVDLLSLDASLSAKVLQVANSARYGFNKEITSLKHASTLLGLNTLRCVTLGVTVFECFSDRKAEWAKKIDLDEFWRHSLAVAVASEMIAERLGHKAPEEAFLAGLLHDIGKIGLLTIQPNEYVDVLSKTKSGDRSLLDYEKQSLAVTHVEVGKWIGEHWGLPEKFRKAIWLHHQAPAGRPVGDRGPDPLEQVVFVADHLARRARIGDAGNHFFQHDDAWLGNRFGLDAEELVDFTRELLKRVQEMGEQFDLKTPTLEMYLKALQEANRLLTDRGMNAEDEIRLAEERSAFLQTLSSIAHLPAHSEAELDLLCRSVDMIRTHFEIHWFLFVATDVSRQTVQGVLYRSDHEAPQTFFRVLSLVESAPSASRTGGRQTLDLLGETVLSNGERVNLREEVLSVLQSGNLIAIPISIDDHCHGECLIDSAGSKIQTPRHREYFSSHLDATAQLYERARLYKNIKRESETAAEALQRESEALRQLFHFERLASVGRLAAGAAHEINNPLAVISGKAQLLSMSESDKTKLEALNSIIDQSMRISKIISDLMGYARPAEPEVTDNHPRAMIENSLYMAKHRLPDHQVETMIEVADEVHILKVDARQIEQVLVNLFVNAIQAMNGIGKMIVRAHAEEGTGMVSIQVTDTGPGIPPDDLNRIFDPFFTTKREGEGTGLGLAVSHRIIESHGGRLSVSSRLGEGTTFTVQLPGAMEGEAEIVQMPQIAARKPVRRTGKKRILLVDDEKQLSDLIRDFLQDAGYVIEQAADGVEAMGLLEARVYDALIMDIRMPRKDGLEVLEELKGFITGMPILVITGLASNEELDQATAFGASRILRKPFQLDELLHAVDELTKKRNTKLD